MYSEMRSIFILLTCTLATTTGFPGNLFEEELNSGKHKHHKHKKATDGMVNIGTSQITEVLQPANEPNKVGFQVSLSQTQVVPRFSDGQILFDNIIDSMPGSIDDFYSKGVFTSPVTGVYLVSLTITSGGPQTVYASVYQNDYTKKMSVVSDGKLGVVQGSTTGMVLLNKYDRLSVNIDRRGGNKVKGNGLSSWSVYLLDKTTY